MRYFMLSAWHGACPQLVGVQLIVAIVAMIIMGHGGGGVHMERLSLCAVMSLGSSVTQL